MIPTTGQFTRKPKVTFLGGTATDPEQASNGTYVDNLPAFGEPWTDMQLINSGFAGNGASSYYDNSDLLAQRLGNYNSRIYFVMLGQDDFQQGDSSSEFQKNFRFVISSIANNTNAIVFVLNLYWLPIASIPILPISQTFRRYQQVINSTAQEFKYQLVDIYAKTAGNFNYLQNDLVHLNQAGQQAVAAKIHNATSTIIQDRLSLIVNYNKNANIIIGILVVVGLVALIPILQRYNQSE